MPRKSTKHIHRLLSVVALLALVISVCPYSYAQLNVQQRLEWEELIKRFQAPGTFNLLTGQMWALTHGGDSKKTEEILNLLSVLDTTSGRRPAITTREYKNRIAAFLESDDDLVAGFAATLLAITGDLSFAPQIAKLLDTKDPERVVHDITSRGSAAFALSLLEARDYIPKVALLLKSKNDYDRAGAARALARFRATEYAKDIAELLKPESGMLANSDAPIYALMEMGVGATYAAEFARVVRDNRDEEMTAMYALAKLRAREYAKDLVPLLVDTLRKADATNALAMMGATEYADQIARLLNDKDSSNRSAALTALGILGAKKYQQQIAIHLRDAEDVRSSAAFALVLLDADRYATRIIRIIEPPDGVGIVLLQDFEFHPLVADDLLEINSRFKTSFARMKRSRKKAQKI